MSKFVKIPLEQLIILEGTSKETGKAYSFVKLKSEFGNSTNVVKQMKEAGVAINSGREQVVCELEITN